MRHPMILLAFLPAAPVLAADLPRTKAPPSPVIASIACSEKDALPPDVFGFGSGSDVASPGSLGAGLEYGSAFGVRVGRASAHEAKASLSYGLAPCVELGPSLSFGLENNRDPAAGTKFRARSVAGAVEIKGKVLTREAHGMGLTFSVEPGIAYTRSHLRDYAAPLFASGSGPTYGVTAKMLTDFAILPNRLYGALNLEYAGEATRRDGVNCETLRGSGYCKGSYLAARGALAYKVNETLFLGADFSHERVYEGAFLNRDPGYAWFAGPNLFWAPNETVSFNAAWSAQLAGKAHGQPSGQKLNLDDFSRHVVKAKLSVGF